MHVIINHMHKDNMNLQKKKKNDMLLHNWSKS